MNKRAVILILAFLSCTALCAGAARKTLLRDGFGLMGVDGELSNIGDRWFFKFDSEVSDDVGEIDAGTVVELLPSSALEKIITDAQKRTEASYRLWGNVTKYKGNNYIFPIYFLPISAAESQTKPERSSTPQKQKAKIAINEPNDELAMPEEIVGKLKNRRVLRNEQVKEGMQLKQDSILAGRTALLGKRADGQSEVTLDAIGRNIPQISFRLLPCGVLEQAQQVQSVEADPVRFKIAGILTQYKGEHYLLLQKAIQAYSHGNFGR
ncbi:MAG: hypothetical protein PHQ35_01925 [Phycisphaerae bacterium]|nr:hypothetical protein [Phycisphaerae bacterium]MDD5380402.1 hypothetical protein [Phycisphaerae bacterium]